MRTKTLSLPKQRELQALLADKMGYEINSKFLADLWQAAVYYNKLQNDFLKDEEQYQEIRSIYLYDETLGTGDRFSIRAYRNYSRKDWFLLLAAH